MSKGSPQPQQPPKVPSLWRFYTHQLIGVTVFVLILTLTFVGVLDATQDQVHASSGGMTLSVKYPSRARYNTKAPIEISVNNNSSTDKTVDVIIDKQYLDHFSDIQFSPQPDEITDKSYVFKLSTVPAGEARVILGQFQPKNYWSYAGIIKAETGDGITEVRVRTISLP